MNTKPLASTDPLRLPRKGFVARHPVWTFLVAPAPAAFVLMALFAAGFIGAAALLKQLGTDQSPTTDTVTSLLAFMPATLGYAPFAIVAWLVCSLRQKHGLAPAWPMLSCLLLAILAAQFQMSMQFAPRPSGGGSVALGAGLSGSTFHLGQFLLPTLIGLGRLLPEIVSRRRARASLAR